jgi:hypothetical protein
VFAEGVVAVVDDVTQVVACVGELLFGWSGGRGCVELLA